MTVYPIIFDVGPLQILDFTSTHAGFPAHTVLSPTAEGS